MQVYVLSAVPPKSSRLLQKYGLLSGVETIKHPEVLKVARPDAKQRKAFVKKVEEVIASDRPYSVMGPSVFFTPPDPDKITDKHFIKQWDLQTIRIDLSRLMEDYPETVVWGAELLPYDYAWRKMSDEEFEDAIADLGFSSWEEYADERSRPLTLDEVYDFTQADPVELWEHYHKSDVGKKYASNVPHAFIITPMGYIPYEYIEYVNGNRTNPREHVVFHGSPNLFSKFKPRPHYLTNNEPVVFATPMREIALASLQPWTDDDFEQGVVDEDPPFMIEMYPNAFEDVYSGKQGYLYTLAPDSFYSTDQLTRFEKVSDTAPKVLDVELVENVLEALYASDMQMIPYEQGSAFRSNDYRMRENPEPLDCHKYARQIFAHLYRARLMHPHLFTHVEIITKPFYFVHFTNYEEDIALEGFYGRSDELIDTKRTFGELVRDGHIFAFRLNADSLRGSLQELQEMFDAAEDETRHIFDWSPIGMYGIGIVISKAEMGVDMFHPGDQEMQTIIPIACIDESEMLVVSDFFEQYGLEEAF